jgi:hypothetical protein
MRRILLLTVTVASLALSQDHFLISGKVRDATTNEHLAAANIRVLGTSRGTVANADGAFRLSLVEGSHTIIVSSLGYKPDTARVSLNADTRRDFFLQPSDIVMAEVVVSSEDPAYEIMRRVIANKKRWSERLDSYEMDAFTRQVLKRDTAIASITESVTKGYWQKGDTLREIVKQKRQTENVESQFNFASVGRIVNFYDDEIRFVGYTFVGPAADDAFDSYNYKLLRTRTIPTLSGGAEVFEIQLTPRTRTRPLFEGTISVAGDSYALVGVDVKPNEAFSIPFVKAQSLRYRQQFGLYENAFWLPADIRIDATASIGLAFITIPPIGFSQTSVITNYAINIPLPDSVFKKPRLSVDTLAVATFDSSFWQRSDVLPLTLEETRAYATLDSTQSLDVQFRPRGFAINIGAGDSTSFSLFDNLDFHFNRVEGFHLGAKNEFDNISTFVSLRAGFAYGVSDKRWKYLFGATVFTSADRTIGFGAEVYRTVAHREDAGYYGALFNTFTSLFGKNDYRDYYEAEGWRAFLDFNPSKKFQSRISFINEKHRSARQNTDFSFFAKGSAYRPNPTAEDGMYRGLRIDMRLGDAPTPLEFVRVNSLDVHADLTSREGAGNFGRAWATATAGVPTFSRSLLFPQMLWVRLSGGIMNKNAPQQFLFDLESASSNYAPFGVFKAMEVKEFSGTRFVALTVEHNFRSVPFLALDIPFLYENNIEFIVHAGIAQSWRTQNPLSTFRTSSTEDWYSELGFGFSKIFDVLRADFTWRLSAPTRFRFTLGVASVF